MGYVGWVKQERVGWQAVAEGDTIPACHKSLLAEIRKRAIVPVASAVLPVGQDPEKPTTRPGNG
jgi:hypothetical protein